MIYSYTISGILNVGHFGTVDPGGWDLFDPTRGRWGWPYADYHHQGLSTNGTTFGIY